MEPITVQRLTREMLLDLGFSPRHIGYKALCIAIPDYAGNSSQYITKRMYPDIAKRLGLTRPMTVERNIRYAICDAWKHGDPQVWKYYFPRSKKAPSNLEFIATIAEYIK